MPTPSCPAGCWRKGAPAPASERTFSMTAIPKLAPADVPLAAAAAQCVVDVHLRLADFLRAGQTLGQIDAFVARTLESLSCRSCFIGYKAGKSPAFPSHACLSVNDCVVHGTAASHLAPLGAGDVLKIDIGVLHKGFIGDAAWTYVFGAPTPEVKRLMDAGKESLRRGCQQLRPGKRYIDFARAVQGHVEGECKFHLVRGLGGHGYGRKLHQAPYVSNVVPEYPGDWPESTLACEPGTLVAVEPMIAAGTHKTRVDRSAWPVRTADGSMSVHYEHDVLITAEGPRVLTAGLEQVRDVIEV
jgi:methionyl aminopeptidase